MKKKILEALKTKFPGVQDSVLNRIAEKLANTVTTDEGITTAVEGVTIQQVIDSYADSRSNEAIVTAVANYEKKHGLKEGVKIEGDKPGKNKKGPKEDDDDDDEGGEKIPKWAKTMSDNIKTLTDSVASIKGEKVADTRKSKLSSALEKAPEKIRERYSKDFGRMNFETDEDFNTWLEEVSSDVDELSNTEAVKGVVVGKPKGGANLKPDEKPSAAVQARVDARKAETVAPAIAGLPQT